MKMTIQIIIGLIVLVAFTGFVIKNQLDKKNQKKTETKVLMNNGKPILKQFGDLTPKDFEKYPVWVQYHIIDYDEKWYDQTNEETFRPWIGELPVSPDFAMYLILADLKLNDGETFSGFITLATESENNEPNNLGLIQPQIFTKTGKRIGFWTGMFPKDRAEIDDFYKSMNRNPDQIFPISFKAHDTLTLGKSSGIINGFLTIGKDKGIIITK